MSTTSDHPTPLAAEDAASPSERETGDRTDGKQSDNADRSPSPHPTKSASPTPSTSAASAATSPAPSTSAVPIATASAANGDWQAIWSPAHNAYYFYNSKTQETTWANPLQPAPTPSASADTHAAALAGSASPSSVSPGLAASTSSVYDLQAAAAAQGIDPALAYLDPSLVAGPSNPAAFTYTAKFNARTGAFTNADARDPTHLSEFERAKRMSEFYFDVNAWEREVEARKLEEAHEEESKKRKRPTKKDLERFKEQKRLKKIAKTAWLRT